MASSAAVLSNPRAPPFKSRFTVAAEESRKQAWDLSGRAATIVVFVFLLLFFLDNNAAAREEQLLSLEMALGIGGGVSGLKGKS